MTKGKLEVYRSSTLIRSQRWRWRLFADNGKKIAISGEGYYDRSEAERMAVRVVGGAYEIAVTSLLDAE